eukprot:1176441-Prorocentrum_minimum.AAC.1
MMGSPHLSLLVISRIFRCPCVESMEKWKAVLDDVHSPSYQALPPILKPPPPPPDCTPLSEATLRGAATSHHHARWLANSGDDPSELVKCGWLLKWNDRFPYRRWQRR